MGVRDCVDQAVPRLRAAAFVVVVDFLQYASEDREQKCKVKKKIKIMVVCIINHDIVS